MRTGVVRPTRAPGPRPRIVLAHGCARPAPLPGRDALRRSVFHCAFCDRWEVRDRPLAFHGSGPGAVRSALVLAGWSNDVVLCTDGAPEPVGELLAAAGVRLRTSLRPARGTRPARADRVLARPGRAPRSAVRDTWRTSRTARRRARVRADRERNDRHRHRRRTTVAGVYAAGDAATAHSPSWPTRIGARVSAWRTRHAEPRTPVVRRGRLSGARPRPRPREHAPERARGPGMPDEVRPRLPRWRRCPTTSSILQSRSSRGRSAPPRGRSRTRLARNPTDHSSASCASTSRDGCEVERPDRADSNSCSVGHHLAPERLGL